MEKWCGTRLEKMCIRDRQNGTCSGVVKDNTGEVIVGASVRVKNSSLGAITDIDGRFTLSNVGKGTVVVVTYLGYKPVSYTHLK